MLTSRYNFVIFFQITTNTSEQTCLQVSIFLLNLYIILMKTNTSEQACLGPPLLLFLFLIRNVPFGLPRKW